MPQPILKIMMQQIAIALGDLFDRSFETKSFGGREWEKRKMETTGSLMLRSGALRRSISAKVSGFKITFYSNLPYAKIHNEGGKIKITRKMQRYFWAMHYMYSKRIKRKKDGTPQKASLKNSQLADYFKALALRKVGKEITIPQRQFLGYSPEVDAIVKRMTDKYIPLAIDEAMQRANPQKH